MYTLSLHDALPIWGDLGREEFFFLNRFMRKKMFYGADKMVFENAKVLRNNLTPEEIIYWGRLKEYFPTYKFRRQYPIGNYIADFYCHSLKLVIEIDGSVHYSDEAQKNDLLKEKDLQSLGLTIIRFTNNEIVNNAERSLKKIDEFINNNIHSTSKV